MSNPRYRDCNRKQQRKRWAIQGLPCYICGQAIDYTLKAPDPYSFVIDETIPLKHGGTLTYDNQGPAHWWCNRIKSTHSLAWARRQVNELIRQGKAPRRTDDTINPTQQQQRVTSSNWFD